MEIKLKLNGKMITASVDADTVLLDFLREKAACPSSVAATPPTAVFAPS